MTIEQILRNDPFFVGFDRIFDRVNTISKLTAAQQKYPPYNIIKSGENSYLIELAVAGFKEEEIDIEIHDGVLTIRGNISLGDSDAEYIYKGIAARNFERKFTLADTVEVDSIDLNQGMLTVRLVNQIPEEKKPRKLQIGMQSTKQLLTE